MEWRLDRIGRRIADIGLSAIQGISFIGQAARLILQSFHLLIRWPAIGQPVRLRHVVQEIITGGIQSLPVVILMASTIGVMLSIQGIHSLRIFGAETQVSFGLALSIPREFAPLITGIIVTGRSGSQLASRVGSMRLNGEIDALTVMGISPVRFIVAPALFGLLISLPILVGVATVASLTASQLYIEATIGIVMGLGVSGGGRGSGPRHNLVSGHLYRRHHCRRYRRGAAVIGGWRWHRYRSRSAT